MSFADREGAVYAFAAVLFILVIGNKCYTCAMFCFIIYLSLTVSKRKNRCSPYVYGDKEV